MTDHYANSLGGRFAVGLLGGFQLFDPRGRRLRIASRKARALLAYLALPVGRCSHRAELAALLWPNASASRARASLRRALSDLRSAIGDALEANVHPCR